MRIVKEVKWPVAVAVLGLCLTACQSNRAKPKEEAMKRWNQARSSVLASLADRQYRSGEFDQARKTVDQAIQLTPASASLHVLSARLAMEQGQLELAERELKQAQTLDPKNAEADYYCGIVYQRWQKPQIALQFYTSASENAPTEPAYLLARAEMLVNMDRSDEALALLQGKLAYFEHSAALRDAVGSIFMNQGRYQQAAAMFRQAGIFADDDQGIREHFALALYFDKQYRPAVPVFERLMTDETRQKRPDLQLAMGECLMRADRPRDARDHLQIAARLDGTRPGVWTSLAQVEMMLNDDARARISLQRALSLNPASNQANLLMGYLSMRKDKLDNALAFFQTACKSDPSDATSLCMVGYVLQKMGRAGAARQWYAAALKLQPRDELASKLLAGIP
jgi:Tfp pilus assembly protein PilF